MCSQGDALCCAAVSSAPRRVAHRCVLPPHAVPACAQVNRAAKPASRGGGVLTGAARTSGLPQRDPRGMHPLCLEVLADE